MSFSNFCSRYTSKTQDDQTHFFPILKESLATITFHRFLCQTIYFFFTCGFLSFGTLHFSLPPMASFPDYSTYFLLNFYASPFPLPMQFNDTLLQRKQTSQIMFATVGCLPDLFLPFLSLFVLLFLPGTNHQPTHQPHEPKKFRVCGRNCCFDQKLQRPNPNLNTAAVTPRFPFKNANKILTHESPSTQHSCSVRSRISLLFPLDDCVSVILKCHTPSHGTFSSIESK